MALKNLSSLFDLVGGNQSVGNMSNQQGAQSFDLGPDSTLQQNSLPEIPVDSPYQDLDAVDGGNGYFHDIPNPGKYQGKQLNGRDLHEAMLTQAYTNNGITVGPSPGPSGNSLFQDMNGSTTDFGEGFSNPLTGNYMGRYKNPDTGAVY